MTFKQHIQSITQDAVIWLGLKYWKQAKTAIEEQTAMEQIVSLLVKVPTTIKRDTYIKAMVDEVKKFNQAIEKQLIAKEKEAKQAHKKMEKAIDENQKKQIQAEINSIEDAIEQMQTTKLSDLAKPQLVKYVNDHLAEKEKDKKEKQKTIFNQLGDDVEFEDLEDADDPWKKAPKFMDVEEIKKHGFCVVDQKDKFGKIARYGYYSYNPAEQKHVEITNFSIKPIFHVRSGRESRHLIEVDNGKEVKTLDVESKAMVSIDLMQNYLVSEGNFVIFGAKLQYLRIASKLLDEFRMCNEIKSLGWQRGGFYAFVNKIYRPGGGLQDLDEWGVATIDDAHFLIPAASAVYKKMVMTDDDPYKNDRAIEYFLPKVTLNEWARKMQRVYLEKGLVAVAYCIMCTFRDIAFDIDHNFPHLYAYGERSSGKSKWADSINSFFFYKRDVFNLNSGTDFAFFSYMGRFRNCAAVLNEFDEKVIKPEWFQSIKGVFDGESRQRGSMVNRGKTETMTVESGLVLVGQYIVTMDDNSVPTRSIVEPFSERALTETDKQAYIELKNMEGEGITGLILELLQHRAHFVDNYKQVFNDTISEWRSMYTNGSNFNQRIMQNWAHLWTSMHLASQKIDMKGLAIDIFKQYCFQSASKWCKFVRSSDTLNEFWQTLLFLVESNQIHKDWDFRVETLTHVTIRKEKDETFEKNFNEPTNVLYLRLNNVHKLYQESYKKRSGKEGMNMENLLHYLANRTYYIGPVKNVRFKKGETNKITNAYAFYYNELDLDLMTLNKYEAEHLEASNGENNKISFQDEPF